MMKGNIDISEYLKTLELLNESPARTSEIVTAGWLHRAVSTPLLQKCLANVNGQIVAKEEVVLGTYQDLMQDFDALLEKSIEVSVVHSVFVVREGTRE